jgi:hypothetical protein
MLTKTSQQTKQFDSASDKSYIASGNLQHGIFVLTANIVNPWLLAT